MRSLPLKDPSRRIGAPKDWNVERDGICHTVEVWDIPDSNGINWMTTVWEPSAADKELIAAGKPLVLKISGRVHPVVQLYVGRDTTVGPIEGPFEQCSKCGAQIDTAKFPEGSFVCSVYHGIAGSGYCPMFVDGRTRLEQIKMGTNGGPPFETIPERKRT